MKLSLIYIFLVCVAINCKGQHNADIELDTCQFVSAEMVSEEITLLRAIETFSNDTLNIIIDQESFIADSLIISDKNRSANYYVKIKMINFIELREMFSIRQAKFMIYIEDKQVIFSEKTYYSLIKFMRI